MSIKHFVWIPVIVFLTAIGILVNHGMAGVRLAEANHGLSSSALQLTKTGDELERCVAGIGELVRRVQGMERLMSASEIGAGYADGTRCLESALERMEALFTIHRDHGGDGEGAQLVAALHARTTSWLLEAERILGLVPARSIMNPHAFELRSDEIRGQLDTLETVLRHVPTLIARQNELQLSALYRMLFLSLLLFVPITAVVVLGVRRFLFGVERIAASMHELCRGNVAVDLPVGEGGRELALLATGVAAFRDALSTVIEGERRNAHLANHDPLTNAFNRRRLMELGEELIGGRGAGRPAVLKIDLDRFKQINDTYGHAAGDAFLVDTVDVMREALREGDVLARLGGDEFAVLLEDSGSPDEREGIIERMMRELAAPVRFSGQVIDRGVSIGASVCPDDGDSIAELLASADVALYAAKARGRGRLVRVDGEMIAANRARIDLGRALEEGAERDEFTAHFQPKVGAVSGRVVGFEALARWNHAERGVLGPHHFIEVAESSDAIVRIGERVLLEAVRAARLMKEAGLASNISVNASARELNMPGYAERILATLREHGLDASAISVELLETVTLEDAAEQVSVNLRRLGEGGVLTWIDDFGVGFSTVGVLQHGCIHGIKIDRRFVCTEDSGAEEKALLNAIVRMAHGMGKCCVLEGVENEAELSYARKIGCDIIQGYHYARPMPLEDVLPWWLGHDGGAPSVVEAA